MLPERFRMPAIAFLILQGAGALVWWWVLLLFPSSRAAFLPSSVPEVTLLAFLAGDVLLFAGGSLAAGWGLARRRAWGWPVLCAHSGAAVYAGLYAVSLAFLSGGGWPGALLMLPSLVIPPYLAWRLRPGGWSC